VCVEKFIPDGCKSVKTFSAKIKCQKKVFGGNFVTDFFSNFKIKKIFKILENIFLDFHFLKNNDFTFFKNRRSAIYRKLFLIKILNLEIKK
jgi:hypothetical protein